MPKHSRDQEKAMHAKKAGAKAVKLKKIPLARAKREAAFTQEDANDVRLTVQNEVGNQYAGRASDLTLEVVEAALVEQGMPPSWAEGQAPLLHEEMVRQLKEDEEGADDDAQ